MEMEYQKQVLKNLENPNAKIVELSKDDSKYFLSLEKNDVLLVIIFPLMNAKKILRVQKTLTVEETIKKVLRNANVENVQNYSLFSEDHGFWLFPEKKLLTYLLDDNDKLCLKPYDGGKLIVIINGYSKKKEGFMASENTTILGIIKSLEKPANLSAVANYGIFLPGKGPEGCGGAFLDPSSKLMDYHFDKDNLILHYRDKGNCEIFKPSNLEDHLKHGGTEPYTPVNFFFSFDKQINVTLNLTGLVYDNQLVSTQETESIKNFLKKILEENSNQEIIDKVNKLLESSSNITEMARYLNARGINISHENCLNYLTEQMKK